MKGQFFEVKTFLLLLLQRNAKHILGFGVLGKIFLINQKHWRNSKWRLCEGKQGKKWRSSDQVYAFHIY
jgi:hypothetical protein